jgi:hypothetical protein
VRSESNEATDKERLNFLATRLGELNNTASQILIFLSFAIVAAVTFLTLNPLTPSSSAKTEIHRALRWWIGAIFPTVIGILPLKEIRDRDVRWYRILLWVRFVLMWSAIICIFIGAIAFFKAI